MNGFETMYPEQIVMEREVDLPLDYDRTVELVYQTLPHEPTNLESLAKHHIDIHDINTIEGWTTTQGIYWTNDDDDSLFKIGTDQPLDCNYGITSTDPYRYHCMFASKLVYRCKLDFPSLRAIVSLNPNAVRPVRSVVTTPTYHPTLPYEYIHYITLLGRRMNSFNMCFSIDIFVSIETSVKDWIRSIRTPQLGPFMERLNHIQLCTPMCSEYYDANVKLQMAVKPIFYYWVVETLIRNKRRIDPDVCQFKLMYLIGEEKRKHMVDVFPEFHGDVLTYHDSEYKRELLGTPNIVFYLKPGANVKSVADTLCALFPDRLDLTMHVPRFNMRLNNNVYISFGGHNTHKVNLRELYVPDEYRRILESRNPALGPISKRFSGHTLLKDDGTPNNILSYQKLIPRGSFREIYAEHGLDEYYHEVFSHDMFNPELKEDPDYLALYSGGRRTRRRRKTRRCTK